MNVTKDTPVHQWLVRWPDDGSRQSVHIFALDHIDCAEIVCERPLGVHPAYSECRPVTIPALGVGVHAWLLEVKTKELSVRVELALRIRNARWIR